jgi:hypothetical protein
MGSNDPGKRSVLVGFEIVRRCVRGLTRVILWSAICDIDTTDLQHFPLSITPRFPWPRALSGSDLFFVLSCAIESLSLPFFALSLSRPLWFVGNCYPRRSCVKHTHSLCFENIRPAAFYWAVRLGLVASASLFLFFLHKSSNSSSRPRSFGTASDAVNYQSVTNEPHTSTP